MSGRRRRTLFGLVASAVLAAAPLGAIFAQQDDPARTIAAENAALTAQIADGTSALDRAAADLARLRKSKDDLDANIRQVEESAKVHTGGAEFARTVVERLRVLPKPGQFTPSRLERRRMMQATSDANLRGERALRELDDLDAAAATRLAAAQPPVPEAERPRVEAAVRKLLAEQRDLLARLDELQRKRMETLRDAGSAERNLERRVAAAREELTRLLFWMRVPPGARMLPELAQSLAWTISPANWRAAGAVLWDVVARRPFWPAVAVLIAAGLAPGAGACSTGWCRSRPPR